MVAKTMVNKGFSLIEFLVVVALIGILTSIATVSYSTIQKRSRDSHRMSDMKFIQQAFEQYYTDANATYPATCVAIGTSYLPNGIPTDPSRKINGTVAAPYSQICTTTSYCFCSQLEVSTGNAVSNCGDVASVANAQYYCVRQIQ
jgi:prepilin-type N-terminal cleavage/methylation domain-containing protein